MPNSLLTQPPLPLLSDCSAPLAGKKCRGQNAAAAVLLATN